MIRILFVLLFLFFSLSFQDLASAADENIKNVQIFLNWLGYHPGKPDGAVGSQTQKAIKEFQLHHGFPATGQLDEKTRKKITKIAGEYYKCLSGVVDDLGKKVHGKVQAGFTTNNSYFGVVAARGTYLEFPEGSPEEVLTSMQTVIEGKPPAQPLVFRCKQIVMNYRKNK